MDFAVSGDHIVKIKENEKRNKYLDLASELLKLWNMMMKVIPIIIGELGTILKCFKRGCPRGIMVKAMDCEIVVSEFVLQSHYYVHFRANTLGKGMNTRI